MNPDFCPGENNSEEEYKEHIFEGYMKQMAVWGGRSAGKSATLGKLMEQIDKIINKKEPMPISVKRYLIKHRNILGYDKVKSICEGYTPLTASEQEEIYPEATRVSYDWGIKDKNAGVASLDDSGKVINNSDLERIANEYFKTLKEDE